VLLHSLIKVAIPCKTRDHFTRYRQTLQNKNV